MCENVEFQKKLKENYEYCYMESMHYMHETRRDTNTFIVGLSYGTDGIIAEKLGKKSINLAMHSQDLFYDTLHILRAVKNDKDGKIKNCVFAMGYYSLFYDLTMTFRKGKALLNYYAIFQNTHHLYVDKETQNVVMETLREPHFVEYYRNWFMTHPSFYNEFAHREAFLNEEINRRGGWQAMSKAERDEYANKTATGHNKHFNHSETFFENLELLNRVLKILSMAKINAYLIIMPFSKEYSKYISREYRDIIQSALKKIPYDYNFIDFNDLSLFEDDEFADPEHLNERGATKFTSLLNEMLV